MIRKKVYRRMFKVNDLVCLKTHVSFAVYGLSTGKSYVALSVANFPGYQEIYLKNDKDRPQWYHQMFLEKNLGEGLTAQGAREYDEIMAGLGEAE